MRRLSNQAALNPKFRKHLYEKARETGIKELHSQENVGKFLDSLMDSYVYVHDPFIEYYIKPEFFSDLPFGDCDDSALYSAAVLTVLRIPNEYIFVFRGNNLQHVYTRAYLRDKTIRNFDYARM